MVSIVNILKQNKEPLPQWLLQPKPNFDRSTFFNSKTVYYPGSWVDGQPVKLCALSHAAHSFIYVDKNYRRHISDIQERVRWSTNKLGFRGYRVHYEEVIENLILQQVDRQPKISRSKMRCIPLIRDVKAFCWYVILKRDKDLDDDHGPMRLAILFVEGDGSLMYDAIYCQEDSAPPFLVTVVNFGVRGGGFGRDGVLESTSSRASINPNYLLVDENSTAWEGYRDTGATPDKGGMHGKLRSLFAYDNKKDFS